MRRFDRSLSTILFAVLPIGLLACTSVDESSRTQRITCQTDPGTGVILRCEPGDGGGDDGGATCTDIDEDGDGTPHDEGTILRVGSESDDDGDGIDDSDDCDDHPGEDDDDDVDLPYDIKPQLGASVRPIFDAFAEKGAQPAEVVSVTMDGGSWRLAELQSGATFTVTDADCGHEGNRDTGRDRVVVTWRTLDGQTESDHLDLRYCD